MRVGILGTRGIPNTYGGFEQFAQYLALGLIARGHEVFVYNSSDHPYTDSQWNGVQIIHRRDWESAIGTAGQFLYDYNCFRDASRRNYDILLQLGYTSSSIWHGIWPRDAVNVVNMDGLEWKRVVGEAIDIGKDETAVGLDSFENRGGAAERGDDDARFVFAHQIEFVTQTLITAVRDHVLNPRRIALGV